MFEETHLSGDGLVILVVRLFDSPVFVLLNDLCPATPCPFSCSDCFVSAPSKAGRSIDFRSGLDISCWKSLVSVLTTTGAGSSAMAASSDELSFLRVPTLKRGVGLQFWSPIRES